MFVPLNNFSSFSLLEGVPSPSELAVRAAETGIPALALTDRGNLSGALEFDRACRGAGVQPIFGMTIPVSAPFAGGSQAGSFPTGDLVLLAENRTGWRSLCRLSSALNSNPEYIQKGSVPFSILVQEADGLICLTGGANSLVFSRQRTRLSRPILHLLERLRQAFPDRLYIQLTLQSGTPAAAEVRLQAAQKFDLPAVYAPEIYYLDPVDEPFQRVLSAMRSNVSLQKIPASAAAPRRAAFIDLATAVQRCATLPEAVRSQVLAASTEIAEHCRLVLPTDQLRFPEIKTPAGFSLGEYLRERTYQGAQQQYGEITPVVQQRLDHELQVINTAGFASLFLIMDEIIQFAHQADIPTASRGSASSSLVAHCLGITTPDPLRLNLYFERFLNPARSKPPDIDTDVCSLRRDQLIEHIYQHYGRDRVAMVATINRFRRRSALRETAKVFGLNRAQVNRLVDSLPSRGWGPARFAAELDSDPYEELVSQYRLAPYPDIFSAARRMINRPHHLSIHPGGIVIAPHPLTDLVATQLSSKGVVITQYDLEGVEAFGLVKIDILGIRGLTVLGEVADYVIENQPDRFARRLQVLDSLPRQDGPTAERISSGQTIGCFQIESPGMRATLQEIQARSIDDITAALALYRPGPMTGGLKDAFIRRHLGLEEVEHLHPALAKLLPDTYGVILYQEQVLRIAHDLAGLSLADADLLRRAMSHFDPGEQMATLKVKFIRGAQKISNVPPAIAERIWDLMAAFAGYGFPKAHAASYAEIAWQSAWFKTHFPAQFMAAVLANWGGYYSQRVYIAEARRMGLWVQTPDIQNSQKEFIARKVGDQTILFMGLNQVRDLTRRTQNRIIRNRPYQSLTEFLSKVDPRPKEADNLIRAGALRSFGHEAELLQVLPQANQSRVDRRQLPLFAWEASKIPAEPWSLQERSEQQEIILGYSVDHHPLELVAHELAQAGVRSTVAAAAQPGLVVRIAGIRQTWRRRRRFAKTSYYEYIFEDLEGQLTVLVEPGLYRRMRPNLNKPIVLVVEGETVASSDGGEALMIARRLWPIR